MPIFPVAPEKQPGLPEGLTGFRRMISDRAIDWGRFIDIDVLSGLPASVAGNPPPSLILRNLERGRQLHLPSGQAVDKKPTLLGSAKVTWTPPSKEFALRDLVRYALDR